MLFRTTLKPVKAPKEDDENTPPVEPEPTPKAKAKAKARGTPRPKKAAEAPQQEDGETGRKASKRPRKP